MRLFGLEITRQQKSLQSVSDHRNGGWWPLIQESFPGAWQKNIAIDRNMVLTFHAIFACETLIASDIAKLRVKLVEQDDDGIWSESKNSAYSPVLRRPNSFQNRIQFWENWILSKLNRGNTYVLKGRDGRGVVNALYILDPTRVTPLVSDDGSGSIFYQLSADNLSRIGDTVVVPAREIIHDRMNCIFHPLVGISPIYASGLSATQGINIQTSSARLFENNSSPGGVLTAPGVISDVTAKRLKEDWEDKYSGKNVGRVAVLGDGLKYEKMSLTAVEGQLIEQLKWSAEVVCSTFHVPPYKIGVGALPSYNNVQSLNVEYYSQCLQILIESAEIALDEGLEMKPGFGTEFDQDNLLRMDSVTQMDMLEKSNGKMTPNEQRKKLDLRPVTGGDSPMLQQQNFSLEALAKRDAQPDPFATSTPTAPALPAPADDEPELSDDDVEDIKALTLMIANSHFEKEGGVIPFGMLKYNPTQRHTPGGHGHDQQTHAGDDDAAEDKPKPKWPTGTAASYPTEPSLREDGYPMAGQMVDGLEVDQGVIPNTDSIGAELGGAENYTELPGIRDVPFAHFEAPPSVNARTRQLAEQIMRSGQIKPLIVVVDAKGPYILEGSHRYDALQIAGKTRFPALVIVSHDDGFDLKKHHPAPHTITTGRGRKRRAASGQ